MYCLRRNGGTIFRAPIRTGFLEKIFGLLKTEAPIAAQVKHYSLLPSLLAAKNE